MEEEAKLTNIWSVFLTQFTPVCFSSCTRNDYVQIRVPCRVVSLKGQLTGNSQISKTSFKRKRKSLKQNYADDCF